MKVKVRASATAIGSTVTRGLQPRATTAGEDPRVETGAPPTVVWTEQALERLQEIEDYISQDSAERALAFVNRLIDRGESLAKFPTSGRRVPELSTDDLRETLEGNYRLVYRLKSQRIDILTVFEGHQQFPYNEITLEVHEKTSAAGRSA